MKYFFGFGAVILLTILTFVLIWRGFGGGGESVPQAVPLSDYTFTTTAMRFTTEGLVNADKEHRAIRITVSRSESRVEVLGGYQRSVLKAKSFASNQEAYATFLRALDKLGYTDGVEDPELADDRGFCPQGQRYIYEIVNGTDVMQRYWASSCRKEKRTFLGKVSDVNWLFQNQISGYREFIRSVKL